MLEVERTLDAGGWKQRERDGFGRFLTRKRSISLELLIIGSGYQGLVEREDGVMEVQVCCGGAERNGERERWTFWSLQKRKKQERVGLWIFQGHFYPFNLNFRTNVNFLLGLEMEFLKHDLLSRCGHSSTPVSTHHWLLPRKGISTVDKELRQKRYYRTHFHYTGK